MKKVIFLQNSVMKIFKCAKDEKNNVLITYKGTSQILQIIFHYITLVFIPSLCLTINSEDRDLSKQYYKLDQINKHGNKLFGKIQFTFCLYISKIRGIRALFCSRNFVPLLNYKENQHHIIKIPVISACLRIDFLIP